MANERLLAFEGVQGFGANTTGGRGGEVIKVTNLNDSGKGSLRWALEENDGPRTVVFEVGGLIRLNEQIDVNGDVTIAGQTAPGGITIGGARLRLTEDNVIIRGLSIRPGDEKWGDSDYDSRDGISIGTSSKPVKNIVIDGNSISWSVDEGISLWGDVSNVTIANNIIGEALDKSKHPEGAHSMALLLGDGASEVSIYGNLFAHNKFRNPTIKDGSHEVEFINNLIYNYGDSGFAALGDSSAHVINNVFIKGKDSIDRAPIRFDKTEKGAEYYVSGNIGGMTGTGTKYIEKSHVFQAQTKDYLAAKDVEKYVLANAGANPDDRSTIDARIIKSVIQGTGEVIDSQDEVGGYKVEKGTRALSDTDKDGIPDVYEKIVGSDARKSDANKDADGDGYTNIEEYINGLIDGFPKSGSSSSNDSGSKNNGPESSKEAEEAAAKAAAEKAAAEKAAAEKAAAEKAAAEKAAAKKQAQEKSEVSDKDEIVVEAEDMKVESGFSERSNKGASGDKMLQGSVKEESEASMLFNGKAGAYDLSIDYFDETDGESELTVKVNNREVATWAWDEDLGSHLANHLSLASKVIEGLELKPGDEISLSGRGDGREPLRVDKLVFESKDGDVASEAGPSAKGGVIRVEAEKFDLSGFKKVNLKVAENKKAIMREGDGEHRADYDFKGATGTYDILIDYFDESDGESELTLAINGKAIETWEWDDSNVHHHATKDNATTRVIENVRIKKGDEISLIGEDDGKEPLRIDAVEFAHSDLGFV